MKKFISLSLCGLAVFAVSAQQATVDQAKKLAGKIDKIEEARSLIQQALNNPETSGQAQTFYTAGKIEWDAYDKNAAKQLANPGGVNPIEMGNELLNGYNYYIQVFPLDLIPNEKGEVKPKYTKELQKKMAEKIGDFWAAGAVFNDSNKYYPEAYQSFMIYGDMPEMEVLGKAAPVVADTLRSKAYFYGGLMAYSAKMVDEAADAFKKARLTNPEDTMSYNYEIASWSYIAQNDTSREVEARDKMMKASQAGFQKFGLTQPDFIKTIINVLVDTQKENDAMDLLNDQISSNADSPVLLGLRAFVFDRMNNDDASEADYRKAIAMQNADQETIIRGARKLYRVGQHKLNEIELGDPETRAKKEALRNNYFIPAKEAAEKAKEMSKKMNKDTSDIDSLIDNIDYQLSL